MDKLELEELLKHIDEKVQNAVETAVMSSSVSLRSVLLGLVTVLGVDIDEVMDSINEHHQEVLGKLRSAGVSVTDLAHPSGGASGGGSGSSGAMAPPSQN